MVLNSAYQEPSCLQSTPGSRVGLLMVFFWSFFFFWSSPGFSWWDLLPHQLSWCLPLYFFQFVKGSIQTDLLWSRLIFFLFLTNELVNLITDERAKLFLVDPSHCCLRHDLMGSAGLYRRLLMAVAEGGELAAANSRVVRLLFGL